jgi:RHS Repeat
MDSAKKISLGFASILAIATAMPAQASETITYKYDAKGRLVEVKRTGTVNNNVTTTYQHDKADNRKNVTTTGSANAPPP